MTNITIEAKAAGLPVAVQRHSVRKGKTIEEMALELYGSTDGIKAWVRGNIALWEEVPYVQWRYVRPRQSDVIRFTFRPNGGGKRNIFAAVAAIAIAVVAPYLATTVLGFAAGSLGATLAATAITVGGSLLVSKLFPPEVPALPGSGKDNSKKYREVESDSNVFGKESYLPFVVGSRRIAPPDVTEARIYTLNGIETVDRLFGIYGKHSITEVRVNDTSVTDFAPITTQVLDGDEATTTYTFIDKVVKTDIINDTLSTFAVSDGNVLEDQEVPANSEPRWLYFSTPGHDKMEEILIRFKVQGFYKSDSETQKVIVPLRWQFRPKGGGSGDWVSLPEQHITGRSTTPIDQELRIRWDDQFGGADAGGAVTHTLYSTVPAASTRTLSDGSSGVQWQSAAYFDSGATSTDVQNIIAKRQGLRIRLDTATTAKGAFEWRVKRGFSLKNTDLSSPAYTISAVVESLFLAKLNGTSWDIPIDQGTQPSQVQIVNTTVIANDFPVQLPGTGLVAMRSKGQSVKGVTVNAARYVNDWNGSAWATSTASSKNPATHYRQVLYDYLTFYGIDTALIDDTAIVAWRTECASKGYECNAVFAGESILEILQAIATAGFAKPVFGDKFSIDYFRDRSADTPVQTFSLRNCENITFSIDSPERQAGFRVGFDNEDNDFKTDEVEVVLDNSSDTGAFEAMSYRAITDKTLVRRRAYFDLLQIDRQRRTWQVQTAIEGVACSVGDMVSLVTDLFDDNSHGARIRQVIDTTHLLLDQSVPAIEAKDFTDNPPVADLFTIGERSIIFIHTSTGVEQKTITAIEGNIVTINSACSTTPVVGAPVSITTLSNATHRCIVSRIERQGEERATLTLVDEAPDIYSELTRKFG